MKRYAFRILLSMAALIFCLVVLEFILRRGWLPDGLAQHLLAGGDLQNPTHRVLILGDSSIMHAGPMDEFLTQALAPHHIQILNLAGSGMGPFEYTTEMEAFGARWKPDLTVLCYFVENDLTNVQCNRQYLSRRHRLIYNRIRPMVRRSHLYYWLKDRQNWLSPSLPSGAEMRNRGVPESIVQPAVRREVNPWMVIEALDSPHAFLDNLLMETPENRRAWQTVAERLDRVRQLCERVHSRFILVAFPSTLQVSDYHFPFFSKMGYQMDRRTLTEAAPQDALRAWARPRGIPVMDLLPVFRRHRRTLHFLETDPHMNRRGVRLALQPIAEFILKNLPPASNPAP